MTRPAAVATGLITIFVLLMATGGLLAIGNGEAALARANSLIAVFAIPFGFIGALLVWRRPRNRVGWVITAIALSFALWFLARQYAVFTLVTEPGSLPAGVFMLWMTTGWADLGWALAFTYLPLLFPDGGVPSPRWRPVAWLAAALVLFNVVAGQLLPHHDLVVPAGAYPFGLSPQPELRGRVLVVAAVLFYAPVVIVCFAAPLVRFRAAKGIERQQLKWFIFAAAVLFVGLVVDVVPLTTSPEARLEFGRTGLRVDLVSGTLLVVAFLALPTAIGIAILRYRLYDIDVIIRRTLVYGALSIALAFTYVALIAVVQAVLRPFTSGSELAVAASTLLTLALVQPMRGRIQAAVDRRFYRSRYDASRTLDAFTARMRDQVDIDAVREGMLDVVGTTLRPAHASIWLRESRS
jgi:hypothetical protein